LPDLIKVAIIEGQRTTRIRSRRQGAPRSHRHL